MLQFSGKLGLTQALLQTLLVGRIKPQKHP